MTTLVNLLLSFFIVVNCHAAAALSPSTCDKSLCVAVVDAGSSGSRLQIYSYDLDSSNTPVNINNIWSKRVKPGLSSLPIEDEVLDKYLAKLLNNAPIKKMPLYFFATAGMRTQSQSRQQKIYAAIEQWFSKQTEWQLIAVKTIPGKEEGFYGWLAVNYRLGTLKNKQPKDLVGVMDMGGASVQIMYPIESDATIDPNDVAKIEVYGNKITLFVHSFLGLGQTLFLDQFHNDDSCYPKGYLLPNETLATGDVKTCERDVSSLVNLVHKVDHCIQPSRTLSAINNWYIMGGFTTKISAPPFNFKEHTFTPKTILEIGQKDVCQQPWAALARQYKDNDYIYQYCILPAYFYALLVDGYGFKPNDTIHTLHNPDKTGWALGAVLHLKPQRKPALHTP